MSLNRFYISPGNWNPENLLLSGDEARHCSEVLHCKVGDKVIAFNGVGLETNTEITEVSRNEIALRSLGVTKTDPLPVRIILGQAIPKKKNMDLIVQKATELGAHRIAPLLSDRTVVRLDAEERQRKRGKWQRTALEAARQCGQNWIPEVTAPQSLREFLASWAPNGGGATSLMLIASLQPDAVSFKEILSEHFNHNGGTRPENALVLIGPEGDFTPAEIGFARSAGCQPMTLGPIVLRTETAAVYSLSILGHELF